LAAELDLGLMMGKKSGNRRGGRKDVADLSDAGLLWL
jgi:hypothetical protein